MILEVVIGFVVVAAVIGNAYGTAPTVIFLLCALASTYTGYNLLRLVTVLNDPTLEAQGRSTDDRRETLEYEKKLLLQGIKELEADYGLGKVDGRDYAALKQTAESKAVRIIALLREEEEVWARRAEKLLSERLPELVEEREQPEPAPAAGSRRTAARAVFDDRPAAWTRAEQGLTCSACGALNDDDGHFCVNCGRPRATEVA